MRHWNAIASGLQRTLHEEHVYLPVLLKDDSGVALGNDWAAGFLRGVQARPVSWSDLVDSEEEGGCLLPMMVLAHEHHPDRLPASLPFGWRRGLLPAGHAADRRRAAPCRGVSTCRSEFLAPAWWA
jgi:hypothetical protein